MKHKRNIKLQKKIAKNKANYKKNKQKLRTKNLSQITTERKTNSIKKKKTKPQNRTKIIKSNNKQ